MRKIILICLLAVSYLAQSQVPTAIPTLFNGKIYEYTQYLAVDSGLFSPRRDTNFVPKQGGCIVFRQSDSTIYISTGNYTGRKWKSIGSGQGGGGGVYNAGYGLLLVAGNFKVDTSIISTVAYSQGLYNILNVAKLNITDTSSMLIPYLRKADTASMLSKYLRKADTITISNRINLKRNISDTALNAQSTTTRGRSQYLIDSLNAYVSGIYLPLTGGTITGNLRVNNTLTSVSSFISQGEIQAQSAIRHTTLKILNKDTSAYVTWLDRKPYYSDGVNLSLIGTLDADTITAAKVAKYSSNIASVYTDRSFTDKNYVDSSLRYRKIKIVGDSDVIISAINDEIVFFRNATAIRDVALPNPTSYTGKTFKFINSDTSDKRTFTVTGGSNVFYIDGTFDNFIPFNHTFELVSNGTNWIVIIDYNR